MINQATLLKPEEVFSFPGRFFLVWRSKETQSASILRAHSYDHS